MPRLRVTAALSLLAVALLAVPGDADAQARGGTKKGERVSGLQYKPFRASTTSQGRISGLRGKVYEPSPFKMSAPIRYTPGAGVEEYYPNTQPKREALYASSELYPSSRALYGKKTDDQPVTTNYYPNRPAYKSYAFGFGANYVPAGTKITPPKSTKVTQAPKPIVAPSLLRPDPNAQPKQTIAQQVSLLRPQLKPVNSAVPAKKNGG